MSSLSRNELRRLDDAARAGWLYYVAGNTQDDIAKKLGVSRQSAQRLVALSVNEGLIKVRLDHPIARCMELSLRIRDRFRISNCEVVPSDPNDPFSTTGLAQAGAAELERYLKSDTGHTIALGTGRALKACIDELAPMDCPQHKIVSLLGYMASDGSASAYNVADLMGEKVNAKHYPMPIPVLFSNAQEKQVIHQQSHVKHTFELGLQADVTFVGVGNLGQNSPLLLDGFIASSEMTSLEAQGAIGEMISWVYDENGELLKGSINKKVGSVPLALNPEKPVYAIAAGEHKVNAILGALRGKRINALITNEYTAEKILDKDADY